MRLLRTEPALGDQVMKSDHWEGVALLDPAQYPSIEGAPNFRRVPGTDLYGVGQPSEVAVRELLHMLHNSPEGYSCVFWINLREEPLVYVEGTPFSPRDVHTPLRFPLTPAHTSLQHSTSTWSI